MATLSRRVQVLLSATQYARLKEIARSRGKSVGALVRQAVQKQYLDTSQEERLAAVEEMSRLRLSVSDWEQMERESVE
jgi:predicted DNA-binding ribbon-helix-helix protein